MANKPLKSIKYPGLPDTYTFVQIGTGAGQAADAKLTRGKFSEISENTKNLFDISVLETTNITVNDGVATGTAGAFNSAFGIDSNGIMPDYTFKANTRYTITGQIKTDVSGETNNGLIIRFVYNDSTTSQIIFSRDTTAYANFVVHSATGKTISKITTTYSNGSTDVWHIKDLQIEEGAIEHNYIPHTSAVDYVVREDVNDNIKCIDFLSNVVKQGNDQIIANWKNGSINDTVGDIIYNVTLRVISDKFKVNAGDKIKVTVPTNHQFKVCRWASNETFISNGLWYTSSQTVTIPEGTGIVQIMVIMINDQTDIDPATFSGTIEILTQFDVLRGMIESGEGASAEVRFICGSGTGDCTIFKFSNGKNLFIDTGLNDAKWRTNLQSAITELGITHVDYLIISHWHKDHIGNLSLLSTLGLLNNNTICYLPQQFTQEQLTALQGLTTIGDTVGQDYLDNVGYLDNCQKVYPSENQIVNIGGAEISFWNTDHTDYLQAIVNKTATDYNECSLCNYLTLGNTVFVFSGDIGTVAMNKYKKLLRPCNIYKSHHHAVGYVTVPLYMDTVYPDIVVTIIGTQMIAAYVDVQTDGVQQWCEDNDIPNYITGVIGQNIKMTVSSGGWKFTDKAWRYIRADN